MTKDFAIQSNRVLLSSKDDPKPASLTIRSGKVASIGEKLSKSGIKSDLALIDAKDSVVMPGIVDTHAHINEPGRTDWEGFRTATRAAASGGITSVIDMPLNSIPPTTTVKNLEAKERAAKSQCLIHYGFWGGVIPGNAKELTPMIERGVRGFKVFLIESGVDEFPMVSESHLREAMPILASHDIPLLVHAELMSPVSECPSEGTRYQGYLASRPERWEVDAIDLMIRLSKETKCKVHIVHLSAASALESIRKAKKDGVRITVESCPHYLSFSAEDIPDRATHYKCAPPIREAKNRELLWEGLTSGAIDMIVSDHSPCTPVLKDLQNGSFERAWGGISGIQFSLPVVWTEMRKRNIPLKQIVRWMGEAPASLAGLNKGSLAVGADADLVVWDPDKSFVVKPEAIHHKHPVTPYAGKNFFGVTERTFVQGNLVFHNGEFSKETIGVRL